MNQDMWSRSAVELAAMIRAREVSCVEVTESVLERVAVHNGRINAIVADCSAEALRAAERKDREVDGGEALGPLHGVPVTIKENVDVTGQATTNGPPRVRGSHRSGRLSGGAQPPRSRRDHRGAHQHPGALHARNHGQPASRQNPQSVGRRDVAWRLLGRGRRPPRRWGSGRSTTETTSADRCASLPSRAESRR